MSFSSSRFFLSVGILKPSAPVTKRLARAGHVFGLEEDGITIGIVRALFCDSGRANFNGRVLTNGNSYCRTSSAVNNETNKTKDITIIM